jgi:small subunit ribosomal protein S6
MSEEKKLRDYELLYIVDPELDEKQVEEVRHTVSSQVGEVGEIREEDFWGKRRFAYEIDNQRDGYWTCVRFQADPEKVKEINLELRLNENIMRHMICHPTPPRPEAAEKK